MFGPRDDGGGQVTRSSGGDVSGPPVVVLYGLSGGQASAMRESGYFRPEQLVEVPTGGDLQGALDEHGDSSLVLVDGENGEISAPLHPDLGVIPFNSGTPDLSDFVLEFLGSLPPEP